MQVLRAPDSKLRIQTRPVKKITPGLLQTFKDMVNLTKTFKDPEGVGLASTQVGLDGQFFVAKVSVNTSAPTLTSGVKSQKTPDVKNRPEEDKFITVINPKIIWTSKKSKKYFEGCLSVPSYWGEVERHIGIKVTYQDETGKIINANLKGVIAWIFQHEIDHLNGKLFPDRVLEQKGKFYKVVGKDKTGAEIFEEVTI